MNNPLLTTLEIISFIRSVSPMGATAVELQAQFGISIATLKRHLAEARELGAEIEAVKLQAVSRYVLRNQHAISVRLNRWLELERARDLTS